MTFPDYAIIPAVFCVNDRVINFSAKIKKLILNNSKFVPVC